MHNVYVYDETFFFLTAVTFMTENVTFSILHSNHCKGNNSFITIMEYINLKCPWKNGMKQIKATKKYCCKGVSSTPLLSTHALTMGSKWSKNYFLGFYCYIPYTWVDLICWTCFVTLKCLWYHLGHFLFRTSSRSYIN